MKSMWDLFALSLQFLCTSKIFQDKCLFKNKTCGRGENTPAFYPTQDTNACNIQQEDQGLRRQFVFRRQMGHTIRRHRDLRTGDNLEGQASEAGYRKLPSPRAAGRQAACMLSR